MKCLLTVTALVLSVAMAGKAMATPSNQIWIPSTDVQSFMVGHVDVDNYFWSSRNSSRGRDPNRLDLGFTIGVLPFDSFKMEIGIDYLTIASDPNDNHPLSGNAKIGIPEETLFRYAPALAFGIYNLSFKSVNRNDAPSTYSGQNIAYGLLAKTIPFPDPITSLGRFSAGYYRGNSHALQPDRTGMLLSWDRTMSEISDKVWIGVDYMGGRNVNGALSTGIAWRFTPKVALVLGYDFYQHRAYSGKDTVTIQLDIDLR